MTAPAPAPRISTSSTLHSIPNDMTQCTLRALLDEARWLMGQEQAVQYRLAAVLRELDQRGHADGSPMRLPRWLHDHFGLTFGTAREKVRTARALGSLPLIDTAFREGQLSYSKVRALTRAATPQNEAELLAAAQHTSAEGVEHIVRQAKQAQCLGDVQALIRSRSLSTRWDETGALVVQGRLTPEQGEVFLKALAKATELLASSATPSEQAATAANDDRYWARRADALTQLMADSLGDRAASAPGDRHQVVVHVAAETLATTPAEGEMGNLEAEASAELEIQNANRTTNRTTDQDVPKNVPAGTQDSQQQNVPAGTLVHPGPLCRGSPNCALGQWRPDQTH